ncbi:protein HGV2 isoform X2 [Aphidius gifuensis]|nr:protein HGV2 isoform X2 [Aphidius gifuensis]XP_044016922.1 protein HGV2 isoform X2 [Aphidius gifuensis]
MADVTEHVPFTDAAAAISQGKRHLLVRDYTAAVTAFAEGLELLSQKHGDCGDELGEPYLLYGRALLGLAREEAGVLGDGVPGTEEGDEDVEVDDDDEDNDDEKEEPESTTSDVKDASTDKKTDQIEKSKDDKESENKKIVNDDNKKEEKSDDKSEVKADDKTEVKVDEKKEEKVDEKKEVKADEKKEEKIDESLPGSSKDEPVSNGKNGNAEANGAAGDDEEDADDVNEEDAGRGIDLQVAWEVLELAKIVFSKRGKTGIKQLAEAHRLLGEVAMESGNPEVAIADLENALTILETIEPLDPRSMAELNYQLGLAHSLTNDFDKSISHFNKATTLLEARIKELESTNESVKKNEGEIAELKELLPEILEKIADMKDFKQEACRLVIEGIKKQASSGSTNGAGPSSAGTSTSADTTTAPVPTAKPASDISHLVRKKRKNEDPEAETASPCKKPTP